MDGLLGVLVSGSNGISVEKVTRLEKKSTLTPLVRKGQINCVVILMQMIMIDGDDVDDTRLVGRRPGDVASCFASAEKVCPPSFSI